MTAPDQTSPVQTPAPAPRRGPSRLWKIAFAVSVGLNLAVAGVIGGALLRHGGPVGAMAAAGESGFGLLAEAFDDDDRRALRREFIDRRPDLRAIRRERAEDARRLLGALRAEPFDPAALQKVLQDSSARTADRLAEGQGLLLQRIAAMSGAERAAFADRLERVLKRGRDRDKDRDNDGERDHD